MSFDNYYPNRKDWRKQYRKSKVFDQSCRNHGSCTYCEANRLRFDRKKRTMADNELRKYKRMQKNEFYKKNV